MDPKKLDPQEAFDLVTRREGKETPLPAVSNPDIEEGFCKGFPETRPWWQRWIIFAAVSIIAVSLVAGVIAFYWFVTQESEPREIVKPAAEKEPEPISEERAREIIESNLRQFLAAEDNITRERYIFPDGESESREIFYKQRRLRDVPLWQILKMKKTLSKHGEIWFVRFRDIQRHYRAVTFQRHGDDYLLHWLAMKAFCEVPWEQFILKKPSKPVVMRCYLKKYEGSLPLGIFSDTYHAFLILDNKGVFSELALMKRDADGASELAALPKAASLTASKGHPVTLSLEYVDMENPSRKQLRIASLEHMRWQRMSGDAQLPD